jgi:hypothetical protein
MAGTESAFTQFHVSLGFPDVFYTLCKGVVFEKGRCGRDGAVALWPNMDDGYPIVRSTTKYFTPHQLITLPLERLIKAVCKQAPIPNLSFNNAMVELYYSSYRSMGLHSDMAMDLDETSYICLFNCYKPTAKQDKRQLVVQHKITGAVQIFVLEENTAVLFSVEQNALYRHKIVPVMACPDPDASDSVYLGITLRFSKRSVKYLDGRVVLETGRELELLTNKLDIKEFHKLRSCENASPKPYVYSYVQSAQTLSPSDMMEPLVTPAINP